MVVCILDFTEYTRTFDIDCDFVTYYGIISAIPHEWKHILRQVDDAVLSSVCLIDKVNKCANVSRLFYSAYLENVQSDFTKHIQKWNSDLNVNLDKADFKAEFVEISTASICTNIRAFQYKFIHRIVKTNTFAFAICN